MEDSPKTALDVARDIRNQLEELLAIAVRQDASQERRDKLLDAWSAADKVVKRLEGGN